MLEYATEAGHSEIVASDGRILGADTGSGPNGLFDAVETVSESGVEDYPFSDSEAVADGIFDPYELDSDGDTCFDTLEASVRDSEKDGIAGTGLVVVDSNGLVISHTYFGPLSNQWQNPDANACEVCPTAMTNPHIMYLMRKKN